MKIVSLSLRPARWEVSDMNGADTQALVKFADKWPGFDIDQHTHVDKVILAAKNEAQADHFDMEFKRYML